MTDLICPVCGEKVWWRDVMHYEIELACENGHSFKAKSKDLIEWAPLYKCDSELDILMKFWARQVKKEKRKEEVSKDDKDGRFA